MQVNLLFCNTRVLQNVLADIRIHFEDAVSSTGLRRSVRMGAVALFILCLGHCGLRNEYRDTALVIVGHFFLR